VEGQEVIGIHQAVLVYLTISVTCSVKHQLNLYENKKLDLDVDLYAS